MDGFLFCTNELSPIFRPVAYSVGNAISTRQNADRMMYGRVLPVFEGRILPVDGPVALCCAALHVPDPRSDSDALIAATGITHAMPIVTRNVADFEPTGVQIINPWEPMP